MKKAVISISKQGNQQALLLQKHWEDADCYTLPKWKDDRFLTIEGRLGTFCQPLFEQYDALVFIMACGIVVRSIAPYIKSKTSDPAVLVMDDRAQHVISLLSGHLGGANALCLEVAEKLGADPVITTASDVNHLPSVDMLAQEYKLHITSMEDAKTITAMLVNEQPVAWVDEANVLQNREWNNEKEKPEGWIWVSHRAHIPSNGKYVHLVPQNMVLGVGCRKGTDPKALSNFILQTLDERNIHIKSLALLTSIDVKKEEAAILEFAEAHNIPTRFYPAETLKTVEDQVNHSSAFVQQTVGVGSVSATAALLGGNKMGEFIVEKEQREGMTLSIFQIK